MTEFTYYPEVFNATDTEDAQRIILTGNTKEISGWRWEVETGYLIDLAIEHLKITKSSIILDYGCGIGRLAKALIEKTKCFVIGMDISPHMLMLAPTYVKSPNFTVIAPEMLDALLANRFRFDGAMSIWVLQHALHPQAEIERLKRSLNGGKLFIANSVHRFLPVLANGKFEWCDDSHDVNAILKQKFNLETYNTFDPDMLPECVDKSSYWAVYSKTANPIPQTWR